LVIEDRKKLDDRKKIVNLLPQPDTTTPQGKIVTKHGGGTGQQVGKFFIRPLSNRKRKRTLEDEDLDILRTQFCSNGDGVSFVDSRDYTLDQGGWH
jgi:hypothetical protein